MAQERVRAKLIWSPEWDGIIKGAAINFIRENKWRCDPIHSRDDLEQDAYIIFLKICDRYPLVVEAKHFMSLFKSALRNWMHDHARYTKRKRVVHAETIKDVSELYLERIGEVTNNGYLGALLAEAPDELKAALKILEENPKSLWRNSLGPRENLNMRLRRVLGLEDGVFDFVGELQWRLSQ